METPYRTKFLDFDARREPKTDHWCCACQKDLKRGAPFRMVHMVDGGYMILHPQDEAIYNGADIDRAGDLGFQAIGPDCARKLGLEWTWAPDTMVQMINDRLDQDVVLPTGDVLKSERMVRT